jgi:hypothetical protein
MWKNVNHDRIAREVPRSEAHVEAIAYGAICRLHQLPDTIRSSSFGLHIAYVNQAAQPALTWSRNLRPFRSAVSCLSAPLN